MDERKAAILRAVIEEHIATAQPVASSKIAAGLNVSSATVRNEMNELERDGYLFQPHTSSGRVPTDLGYRFYVDQMRGRERLGSRDEQTIAGFFRESHRALEDLLLETSDLLSAITGHTSVILGAQPETATIRSLQLVNLNSGMILLVVVFSTGVVEKASLVVDEIAPEVVQQATTVLNHALAESAVADVVKPEATGVPAVDALVGRAFEELVSLVHVSETSLHVAGKGKLATEAFASGDQVVRLLELLDQQVVVVTMVRDVLDTGIEVRIGSENTLTELQQCSLVLARFSTAGSIGGTVGVLGPTRMDYRRTLAAVSAVSDRLGRSLDR